MKLYFYFSIFIAMWFAAVACSDSKNDDAKGVDTNVALPNGNGTANDSGAIIVTGGTDSTDSSSVSDTSTLSVMDSATDVSTDSESGTGVTIDSNSSSDSEVVVDTESSTSTLADTNTATDTDTGTAADTAITTDTVCADSAGCDPDTNPYFSVDTDRPECVDFPWSVETNPINMLVLLDRSASMGKYPLEDIDKYADIVQNAIDTIVQQHTSSGIVNFALNVFPSPVECDAEYADLAPSLQSESVTCQAASQFVDENASWHEPLVPFAETVTMDTYDLIHQTLQDVGTCGGTPISKSLRWAKVYLESLNLVNPTYVLLATDGAPNCNPALDIAQCESATVGAIPEIPEMCLDDRDSAHAVYDLGAAGFRTFVVGVGETVQAFADTMDVLAYWGTHENTSEQSITDIPPAPNSGTWYYPAGDATSLNTALEAITNDTISCVFDVKWEDIPDKNGDDQVFKSCTDTRIFGVPIDGTEKVELTWMKSCDAELPDATDPHLQIGWTWEELEGTDWTDIKQNANDTANCRRVKLCNNACSKLKVHAGAKEWNSVSASFGCEPIVVIE